jgi:hypothetical protein
MRTLRLLLATAMTTIALAAVAAAPASAAPSWTLVDYHQTACFSPHVTSSWYGIWISGRWRHSIDVGARRLPAGGGFSASYAPIPPGSSTGEYSLAYVRVDIPATTPVGSYTAMLWASDGTRTQRVPVTLNVTTRCGY